MDTGCLPPTVRRQLHHRPLTVVKVRRMELAPPPFIPSHPLKPGLPVSRFRLQPHEPFTGQGFCFRLLPGDQQLPDPADHLGCTRPVVVAWLAVPEGFLIELDAVSGRSAEHHGTDPTVAYRKRFVPVCRRTVIPQLQSVIAVVSIACTKACKRQPATRQKSNSFHSTCRQFRCTRHRHAVPPAAPHDAKHCFSL